MARRILLQARIRLARDAAHIHLTAADLALRLALAGPLASHDADAAHQLLCQSAAALYCRPVNKSDRRCLTLAYWLVSSSVLRIR